MRKSELDVKGRHLPRLPRIFLGGIMLVPAVGDDWEAVKDQWMLPGRVASVSTQEVKDLAKSLNLMFTQIGGRK